MSSKGKGKGKGKGKRKEKVVDPNKLTQVDRTFCELTIADLNKKLAQMRSQFTSLDEKRMALVEELRELKEDRNDVAAYLDRTVHERNDTIRELQERLQELEQVRNEENASANTKINALEARYTAMHNQLQSEIKLLNGKLNSLDEFRIQRDQLLAKFETQEDQLRERELQYKHEMIRAEQTAIVEKNAIKKDVEIRLLQLSEDFTRSSEIRNAGYMRRLIRENIALQKEIDLLVVSQVKMQEESNEQIERHKEMRENYESLDQIKKQLIFSANNKIKIIHQLVGNYEELKGKYVEACKYRKMYKNLFKRDQCERHSYEEAWKKLREANHHIAVLKTENSRLMTEFKKVEEEIERMHGVVKDVKQTVMTAMELRVGTGKEEGATTTKVDDENVEAFKQISRGDLLKELLTIVGRDTDRPTETSSLDTLTKSGSSLYEPGKLGFLPRIEPSLMDVFKHGKGKAEEVIEGDFEIKHADSKIIPKERTSDAQSLFDVELGSTLYVSSYHEKDEQVVQVEEEPLEYGEEGSTSDYQSSVSPQQSQPNLTYSAHTDPAPTIESAKTDQVQYGEEAVADAVAGTATEGEATGDYDEGEEEFEVNLFY